MQRQPQSCRQQLHRRRGSPGRRRPPPLPTAQVVITGNLTRNSSDTLALDINGTTPGTDYDQLAINGTITLGGATLSVNAGANIGACAQYIIIKNNGVDPVTGSFSGLTEGSTFVAGSQTFRIRYAAGTGNDVV